ncbi:hypothetical protein BE221DRAFT_61420 [Ostreococcus tauri]|nr:hypothetical protein BE221DRAFT_61420 [Ostreococcus tauri]
MNTPTPKKSGTPNAATPKTPTTDKKISSEDYAQSIVTYLKEHPNTAMAALGGRVKKPTNFPLKFGEFIKSRKDLFKIEGDYVRLV